MDQSVTIKIDSDQAIYVGQRWVSRSESQHIIELVKIDFATGQISYRHLGTAQPDSTISFSCLVAHYVRV